MSLLKTLGDYSIKDTLVYDDEGPTRTISDDLASFPLRLAAFAAYHFYGNSLNYQYQIREKSKKTTAKSGVWAD